MSDVIAFNEGTRVRVTIRRDRIGTVVGAPRRQGGEWWYKVEFADGRVQNVPERILELYEGAQDVETLPRKGAFGTGGSFTVKKYSSEKRSDGRTGWRHTRIVLSPLNRDYQPIVLPEAQAEHVRIAAEFVGVLGK